jgi:hypothetical protein
VSEPVNEADVLEQQAEVVPDDLEPDENDLGEADPADVLDQRRAVPVDEDD